MDSKPGSRLLSIGEFSAATQLSPKALRLYDEQHLLRPASIDGATGYRYYAGSQIAQGRLIRTLRDMDLPLSGIAQIIGADRGRAESLIVQFALEADQRYAQQKRALQRALAQFHRPAAADTSIVEQHARPAATVIVRPLVANRWTLLNSFRAEALTAQALMKQKGLRASGEAHCVLIDPPSDEDARLELLLPFATTAAVPEGITVRQLPTAELATLSIDTVSHELSELTAALDALFDWFDRRGCHVTESPSVAFTEAPATVRMLISWAYEPVA